MSRAQRIDRIVLSSLPLRRANPGQKPTGTQSSCILAHADKRILLSAAHGPQRGGNWAVETSTNFQDHQTQLYVPEGGLRYLEPADVPGIAAKTIDLAFAEIPADLVSRHQEWTPRRGLTRDVARLDVTLGPVALSTRASYGFHGYPPKGFIGNMLAQNQRLEADLKFVSQQGHLRTFKLDHAHPGHAYYRGCSGAAIVDKDGRLAGIVVSGSVTNRHIYAIDLDLLIETILEKLG